MINHRKFHKNDTSPEEIEYIRNTISKVGEHLYLYYELPLITPFSIDLCFEELQKLIGDDPYPYVLIDIHRCERPDAATRKAINKQFQKLANKVSYVAFSTGKGTFLNTTLKFVLYGSGLQAFSIHKSREEAFKKIEDVRAV